MVSFWLQVHRNQETARGIPTKETLTAQVNTGPLSEPPLIRNVKYLKGIPFNFSIQLKGVNQFQPLSL